MCRNALLCCVVSRQASCYTDVINTRAKGELRFRRAREPLLQVDVGRLKAPPPPSGFGGLHGCVYVLQSAGLSLLRCLIQHRVTFMLSVSTKDSSVSVSAHIRAVVFSSSPTMCYILNSTTRL